MNFGKVYLCIDLKSFFASVECVERGLDPMVTNLVVADPSRTEKTICLAITPAMKALGIKNRCRIFEIPAGVEYIVAPPRMKKYIDYSAEIYGIYLKYVSKDDIQVYSVDEAFLDVTDYLKLYQMTAEELGGAIMDDIKKTLGLTATCGGGTNLYLAKIALDISAKHSKGRIAFLDEEEYRLTLWSHTPITDFWKVGRGTAERLSTIGVKTMGELAMVDMGLLYKMFGIDAELLIDHAWGRETTTIRDIKMYEPKSSSISRGQVLARDYYLEEGVIIAKEMADLMCLDLVDRHIITEHITLNVSYTNSAYKKTDRGSIRMTCRTNSTKVIVPYVEKLYRKVVDENVPIRKLSISFDDVVDEAYEQYDLFSDPKELEKERKLQRAAIEIKKKFGKNAILKGLNLEKAGTTIERNMQIGGHRSGEE